MMAPTTQQSKIFNEFRVKLLNFSRKLPKIQSIEDLMTAQKTYVLWLAGLKKFFEDEGFGMQTTTLFLDDKVISHGMSGGVGAVFGDKRSRELLQALSEEVENKALRLDRLSTIFDIHKTIEKHGGNFHYCRQPITLGKNSLPYHLLDVLFLHSDDTGFISYMRIEEEFRKRKSSGNLKCSNINRKTISNAQLELFLRAHPTSSRERMPNSTPSGSRLIESDKKHQGLVFNNEILN